MRSGKRIECDFSGCVELDGSDLGLSQARDHVEWLEKVLGAESE